MDAEGAVVMRAPAYVEGTFTDRFRATWYGRVVPQPGHIEPELSDEGSVYGALVLGVRDYVNKHGFPGRGHGSFRRRRFGADAGDCG